MKVTLKMELKKLKSDVIDRIRSSFSINTVSQCVTELVLNSLDAKSTAIAVRLNLISFRIQVVDNGNGITKENMPLLGLRYFTNKCGGLEKLEKFVNHYGFRGEAIASIVECSKTVNITSRHQDSGNTYSRMFGKHCGGDVSKTSPRPSVGTTVTIEGLFHNLPVRRKRVIAELELDEIKKGIESLIILHPSVTFSVRNDVKCELILNSQKNEDMISSFKHLHPNLGDDFSLMKISKNKLTIDALIYKSMSENKNLQYIYVNKRPIFSSKIQKLVTGLFKKHQKVERKILVASIIKYPVFVMNIKCPMSKVDILFNSTKTMVAFENWNLVNRCINKLINSFFGKDINLKKKEKIMTGEELKRDCGVSQIIGACRRFGYKRKHIEDETNGKMDKINEDVVEIQMIENEHKKVHDHCSESILRTGSVANNILKEYNPKKSQQIDEDKLNGHISDSTSFEGDFRCRKKFKKPLPIIIGRATVTNLRDINMLPENQDDIKSSISKFTDDQNKGKNLIMDMFLKSTQVYSSDENLDKLSGSQETIYEEESNFQMENNYQTNFKGMSNTMSVSVNVRSTKKIRKKKKLQENPSKYVQTNVIDEKNISKAVQTSMQKDKLEKHGLKGFSSAMHSKNYTVMISNSGEKAHFKFVTKKIRDNDVVEPNIRFNDAQKCHCNCHGSGRNIFNFEEKTNNCRNNLLTKNIEIPHTHSTVAKIFRNQKHENMVNNYHPMNQYASNRGNFENCNLNVERNGTFLNYERSPYFAPNKYLENNQQHPHYPVTLNADSFEPFLPPLPLYSNLPYPIELNRNIVQHIPSEPPLPPYYVFQNEPRLMEKGKHFLRQDEVKMNNPNDWTIGTFGQFKPAHLSTQKDGQKYWENGSSRHTEPFCMDTREEWTINSFGQFKPLLFSTQKEEENYIPKTKIMFTPSPVEECNPFLNTIIENLDTSQEAVKNTDVKLGNEEKKNDTVSKLNDSKLLTTTKRQTQDILDKELEAEKSFLAKEFINWDSQFTQDIGNGWLKKFNKCGDSYYMNKKTGFTTFQTPKLTENQFKFGKRFDFMPKGMSPILTETKQVDKSLSQHSKDVLIEYIMDTYKNELLYVKWQHYLSDVDSDTFFKNIYAEKMKTYAECIPDINAVKKNKNIDNVISFSKDLFKNLEVIGQLDKKFIVVLEKKTHLLILFDQHAVHERIRLEELLEKYDGAKSECAEKMVFFIPQNDLDLLKNHQSYLHYIGLSVEFFENSINVATVPLCLSSKFKDNNFSDTLNKMMQLLIKEMIEHLKSTRGVHLKSLPKLLQNIVNLEACRGAIKFGDRLNKEECKILLLQLSSCKLPFQCAHGRPTLAPLIMLQLNEMTMHSKLNFHKLK